MRKRPLTAILLTILLLTNVLPQPGSIVHAMENVSLSGEEGIDFDPSEPEIEDQAFYDAGEVVISFSEGVVNPVYEDVISDGDIAAPSMREIAEFSQDTLSRFDELTGVTIEDLTEGEEASDILDEDAGGSDDIRTGMLRAWSAGAVTDALSGEQTDIFFDGGTKEADVSGNDAPQTVEPATEEDVKYLDYESAGTYIMDQFLLRATEIVVPVQITTGEELAADYEAIMADESLTSAQKSSKKLSLFAKYLWRTALTHHPEDPRRGDYSAYQYGGYGTGSRDMKMTAGATGNRFTGVIIYKMYSSSTTSTVFPAGASYYYTTAEQEEELEEALQAITPTLYRETDSDFQKIKAIYEYICTHVSYGRSAGALLRYTPYGALVKGTAVCQGYAGLFYRMALTAGVDNRIQSGYATENHAWNVIRLGEKCYYGDTTWDRDRREEKSTDGLSCPYFLCGTSAFASHTANNTTEKVMINGHETGARPNWFNEADYPMSTTAYWGDVLAEDRVKTDGSLYGNLGDLLKGKGRDLWIAPLPSREAQPGMYTYNGSPLRWEDLTAGDPSARPYPHLYDQETALTEGTDYTLTYKNNKNAGIATVTVNFIGNYSGSESLTWTIDPIDLTEPGSGEDPFVVEGLEEADGGCFVYGVATGSVMKPTPGLFYGTTQLKNGTDYRITYASSDGSALTGFKDPGDYRIIFTGKGNYTGSRTVSYRLLKASETIMPDPEDIFGEPTVITYVPLNKVKIKGFQSSLPWAAEPVTESGTGQLVTIDGARQTGLVLSYNGSALKEQTYNADGSVKEAGDYVVTYSWPRDAGDTATTQSGDAIGYPVPGTASITIRGIHNEQGGFTGTLKKTFKITGTSMSKTSPQGFVSAMEYTGNPLKQTFTDGSASGTTIVCNGKTLVPGEDYEVTYSPLEPVHAGKVTVMIKGKRGYTGTVKKTYRITQRDLSACGSSLSVQVSESGHVYYQKGGSCPVPTVILYRTGASSAAAEDTKQVLECGTDFTVRYQNNTKIGATVSPSLYLVGKGDFKGKTAPVFFSIDQKPLDLNPGASFDGEESAPVIAATTPVAVYKRSAGAALIKPVLTDDNGKKLALNKDYTIERYRYAADTAGVINSGQLLTRSANEEVQKKDVVPAGTDLLVTVRAKEKSGYSSTRTISYRVMQGNLSSAKVTVNPSSVAYTGRRILPGSANSTTRITVTLNGIPLAAGIDYTLSYGANTQIGTGTVTVTGNGTAYGGEKTVKFKIVRKPIR